MLLVKGGTIPLSLKTLLRKLEMLFFSSNKREGCLYLLIKYPLSNRWGSGIALASHPITKKRKVMDLQRVAGMQKR
jgi:hypothetical protein